MAAESVFEKILKKEIKADVVHEDDLCLAFKDISPKAPTHVLVVPKRKLEKLADANAGDKELLGHLLLVAADVAKKLGIGEGFRVVVNNGEKAGQSVFYLHLHVLGGRRMEWPPG